MEKRTFFKTPEGNLYSVSAQIMASGYTPAEGVVPASDEDLKILNDPQIKFSRSEIDELFSTKFISEDLYQRLVSKLDEQEAVKAHQKDLKNQQLAEEKAARKAAREAEKQAAIEAEKQAKKQILIKKRQEELRVKLEKKAVAEEAERIEAFEAEKEADKQAAIEAERQAAIEAAKPRKFSAA